MFMKKVGIVAVSNHNYGSLLQTYAMQKAIEKLGLDNEIILFRSNPKEQLLRVLNTTFLGIKLKGIKKKVICKLKYPEIAKGFTIRASKFEDFKNRYCNFTQQVTTREELSAMLLNYSGIILGSDQVWHPANLEMNYFTLNFVPEDMTKIAYAPSFGVSSIPEKQLERTKRYLSRINFLSVREKAGQKIIKNLIGMDVPVVCDPTALLTYKDWDSIKGDKPIIQENYIFCYFLGTNPKHREFANQIKKITGLKIVALQHLDEFVKEDLNFADEKPYNISPADFVNLIANATIVLTDSFHGTMFSIYYHKNFFTFSRYSEEKKESTNSRIASVLDRLQLSDRRLSATEDIETSLSKSIDWSKVDYRLKEFRKISLQYLEDAIDKSRLRDKKLSKTDMSKYENSKAISISFKKECTGCTACANICPEHCIKMVEDNEGFVYPHIDSNKCINCGLCSLTCPVKNIRKPETVCKAFVVQNNNQEQRLMSSSGGFFSVLAGYVLSQGGIVFGAGYNSKMEVVHMPVRRREEMYRLRASKYVQSNLNTTFQMVNDELKSGKIVLFSGTPCQIAGLKNYLHKDYLNLYLIDVICYGVPSPKVFRKYIEFIEEKYNSKVKNMFFRDKSFGYASPNVKILFENGKTLEMKSDVKSFTKTFFRGISTRPSCFDCKFKCVNKAGDFSMGDCWNVKKLAPELDDDKGTTLVFVHTTKAMLLMKKIESDILQREISLNEAVVNSGVMLLKSAVQNPLRQKFFNEIDEISYIKLVDKYVPDTWKNKLANFAKPIIYKMGLTKTGILKVIKSSKIKQENKQHNS